MEQLLENPGAGDFRRMFMVREREQKLEQSVARDDDADCIRGAEQDRIQENRRNAGA
jgi:hypothetical protein